jgi:signal transduction histidine kinase/ligand-binding sensor domain-containing protein/DNA-binding response OmpR family regulator
MNAGYEESHSVMRLSGFTRPGRSIPGTHRFLFALLLFIPFHAIIPRNAEDLPKEPSIYFFRKFTIDDGISQNLISSIHQDHYGFMWFGTRDGLNMFDGYGFRIFRHNPLNDKSLSGNYVTFIYEDSNQRLWVGTFNGGLNYLDRKTMEFTRFSHDPENLNSISGNHIQAITCDVNGNLWVGTNGGGLNKLVFEDASAAPGKNNLRVIRHDGPENGFPQANTRITSLYTGPHNQLWVGTSTGIYKYDPGRGYELVNSLPEFTSYKVSVSENEFVDRTVVRAVFADSDSNIWIGSDQGIFILDAENQIFVRKGPSGKPLPSVDVLSATVFNHGGKEEIWIGSMNRILVLDPSSGGYATVSGDLYPDSGLQRGGIISLYAGDGGFLWVGSNGYGLSLFSPGSRKFIHANDLMSAGQELVSSSRDLSVRSFYISPADSTTLWIGSNQGLFRTDMRTAVMEQVRLSGKESQESNTIFHINGDEGGRLWIGTAAGLVRYSPAADSYRLFPVNLTVPGEGDEPRASFVHISRGHIWILTPNSIARMDQETGEFIHTRYNNDPVNRFGEAVFPRLHEDRDGNFWIAAKNGLHYFNAETAGIVSHPVFPRTPDGSPIIDIKTICADPEESERYLWLGTGGGGLLKYDTETRTHVSFTDEHGLANNTVYGILYDGSGSFWMSTNRGLSKFNISEKTFTNYSRLDGLQSNEFNSGAFYAGPGERMFFGGIYGYNSFMPSHIKPKDYSPPVVITSFRILDNDEGLNLFGHSGHFDRGSNINLSNRRNSFVIEFSSFDFTNSRANQFMFSMTTSGENWIRTGNERSVTFADMNPGIYTLRVRGTNSDGIWSDREAYMTISIATPWWKKTPVYFLYLFLTATIFLGFRRYELSRIRLRNRVRIAAIETLKLKEVDQLKSQFFANISHEFRTPLTLIKGPLEQLIEGENDRQKKVSLNLILSNSTRLLHLINQLLDLSRLESDNYYIRAQRGDIIGFVKGVVFSFSSLAKQKSISLKIDVDPELEHGQLRENFYYDPDILEKIFNNILSNSFKFTPDHGEVIVRISKSDINKKEWLEFTITDTGIGIPREKLRFIFDRFYQVDDSPGKEFGGSGIGLAYVKELVRVHKAEIHAESMQGKGTTFRLCFPVGKDHFGENQIVESVYDLNVPADAKGTDNRIDLLTARPASQVNSIVLIVEDHAGVRDYIAGVLRAEYRIAESSNAPDGIKIATEMMPDLIICDVMMPGMDGFEFCNLIKSNGKTTHIPVILLTARAGDADRITGLDRGADDYLTKPFNARELQTRVRNLINSRSLLRDKFTSNSIIRPDEISVNPQDASFIEKLLRVVERNIDNTAFSVEDLGSEAGMSHSQIHRKLKATVNMTANHFIRSVRMHRAMELLKRDAGNISEIAFMVGYDDPGYFTRTFRNFFGKLPSEISSK